MKYGAVIIETRLLPNLIEIIDRHLEHLPVNWGLRIYCSKDNIKLLNAMYGSAATIEISPVYNASDYNRLMTSEWFYEALPFDAILVFQHDSMLIRNNIMNFMEYDYVGSPWMFQERGGNGGLSVRNVSACLELVKETPYQESIHGNEDVYFSNHLKNVAPREVCMQFACETIWQLGTTGYHAIEKYMSAAECNSIKQQYGYSKIRAEYDRLINQNTGVAQHLPMLYALANRCKKITMFGPDNEDVSIAFIEGKPNNITGYNNHLFDKDRLNFINNKGYQNTVFHAVCIDTLKADIGFTDLLFINFDGDKGKLMDELESFSSQVKKWIVIYNSEVSGPISDFLDENHQWEILHRFEHNNGLTILQRI